jgi:hypothetical protein
MPVVSTESNRRPSEDRTVVQRGLRCVTNLILIGVGGTMTVGFTPKRRPITLPDGAGVLQTKRPLLVNDEDDASHIEELTLNI